jgi:hypothetical protein
MSKKLQLDWLDGIFIALFFLIGISLQAFIQNFQYLTVMALFAAPTVRRKIFGPPNLPEPKEGSIWAFVSIVGLLIIFFSMAILWLATVGITNSKEPMPFFRAEVEANEKELHDLFADIGISVVTPANTPKEEFDKLLEVERRKQEEESKKRIENHINELQHKFKQDKQQQFDNSMKLILYGILLCCLGSLMLRLRYPFTHKNQNK